MLLEKIREQVGESVFEAIVAQQGEDALLDSVLAASETRAERPADVVALCKFAIEKGTIALLAVVGGGIWAIYALLSDHHYGWTILAGLAALMIGVFAMVKISENADPSPHDAGAALACGWIGMVMMLAGAIAWIF